MKKLICCILIYSCVSCDVIGIDNSKDCYKCTTWTWDAVNGGALPDIEKDVCGGQNRKKYQKDMSGVKDGIGYRTICAEKK